MRVVIAGVAVSIAVAAIFVFRPEPAEQADNWVRDQIAAAAGHGKLSGRVAIVEIDEASLEQYGRWPWPRDIVASVARRIFDEGAAVLALDTIFSTKDPAASNDQILAEAIRDKPVVLGYGFRFDARPDDPKPCTMRPLPLVLLGPAQSAGNGLFRPTGALCNLPVLTQAASDSGFLNGESDRDGKLRRLPLVMEFGDRQYAGLALAAFEMYRRGPAGAATNPKLIVDARGDSRLHLGGQAVSLESSASMRLRFRGPGRTFPYVGVADLMSGRMPHGTLAGRVVLLGSSAIGLPGPVNTPVDPRFPDVEVQATAIDNLIQNDPLLRPAELFLQEAGFALATGIGLTFLLARMRGWWIGAVALVFVTAVWAVCAVELSARGLTISPLPVTVTLGCDFSLLTLLTSLGDRREAARKERALSEAREDALRRLGRSEAEYRRLVENVSDAIVLENLQGQVVFSNRRFREWFGAGEGALENHVAPEHISALRERRRIALRSGDVPGALEFEMLQAGGSRMWMEGLTTRVEENGVAAGIQWALRDATERRRMAEQLLQAQKMESVGRLAGGVAHDFNNLLTVINGYSGMLLKGQVAQHDVNDRLAAIRTAGERAAELTRSLLAFARKQPVRERVLDLNEVATQVAGMFGPMLGEDIELTARLMPSPALVRADTGRMTQVLTNLLVNAKDAMPGGGRISIETTNFMVGDELWIRLSVSDNGAGMTEDVRQHLFEPFFTTKEPGKGTGLGLATVYGIVQQARGRIEVSSLPGGGSTFHLTFPYSEPDRSAPPVALGPNLVPVSRYRIFVVEDQAVVRGFVSDVLRGAGHSVIEAECGPDALTLAGRFTGRIDLLLTDLVMPRGIGGTELAAQLKRVRPSIRVLFTSGYSEEATGERGIIAGGMAFLPKPFSAEALIGKVREVMANPDGQASSARA